MPSARPAILALLLAAIAALALGSPARAATCAHVAAPTGSDRAAGTVAHPFRTAQKVIESLRPGDTGCLRDGRYDQEVNGPFVANFFRGGRKGAPITLRSYPGERAQLRGITTVSPGADYVTITGLSIDGRRVRGDDNPIGIQLMAKHTVLSDNDITDPTANCVTMGVDGWGTAVENVIRGNVFHDCGHEADGLHDHAIYVNSARGGSISDNLIVRSAAFAVHFYGHNRDVTVDHNVIADNGGGIIFAGYKKHVSSHNTVTHNVIVNSSLRPGLVAWWDGAKGTGNVASSNCLADNAGQDVDEREGGFTASRNLTAAPEFVDPANGDLRLAAASPCLRVVGYDTVGRLGSATASASRTAVARGV